MYNYVNLKHTICKHTMTVIKSNFYGIFLSLKILNRLILSRHIIAFKSKKTELKIFCNFGCFFYFYFSQPL